MSAPLTYEQFLDLQQDNEVGDLWRAYSEALAVVAVQREALDAATAFVATTGYFRLPKDSRPEFEALVAALAALDTEGVSEPDQGVGVADAPHLASGGTPPATRGASLPSGSLTSPVDTAPLLVELARKSRVAEWDGDLHARIASVFAQNEEREERRRRALFEGIDTHAR